jgi:hypothetical protein
MHERFGIPKIFPKKKAKHRNEIVSKTIGMQRTDEGVVFQLPSANGDFPAALFGEMLHDLLFGEAIKSVSQVEIFSQAVAEGDYPTEQNKRDLYDATKQLAAYVQDEAIEDVAFLDRSARPGYRALIEYWRLAIPDAPVPHMYFLNPLGFETEETLNTYQVDSYEYHREQIDRKLRVSGQPKIDFTDVRSEAAIHREFAQSYQFLHSRKDKPLLLVDTCIHDGNTAGLIMDSLGDMGFSDVRLAVATDESNYSAITPDVVLLDRTPDQPCLTFYPEYGYYKTLRTSHVVYAAVTQENNASGLVRKLVRDTIREQFAKDPLQRGHKTQSEDIAIWEGL